MTYWGAMPKDGKLVSWSASLCQREGFALKAPMGQLPLSCHQPGLCKAGVDVWGCWLGVKLGELSTTLGYAREPIFWKRMLGVMIMIAERNHLFERCVT